MTGEAPATPTPATPTPATTWVQHLDQRGKPWSGQPALRGVCFDLRAGKIKGVAIPAEVIAQAGAVDLTEA